ncbi:WxL domain-containing protein [Vagococcus hydrophili]|uniref:WxL domain-containing protein n=1 Tax=Vagococcus hydrophili TaxID=2714947 RepID=A0A6G8ATS8_9ENTE|nr:WxL domain-containing protein [Vagococcus hydrophili]QIL48397.1 WxL domain-containing protein [Vagococcus hydrophili]
MKKVFLYGALLGTTVGVFGGITTAFAEAPAVDYETPTKANSDAKIKFIDGGDPEIVDPIDPTKVVDPVDPVNPNRGDLMIQYVSNFDFGVRKRVTSKELTANAKAVKVVPKGEKKEDVSKQYEVMPFVSTLDMRPEREGGWNLQVNQGEFTFKKDGKNIPIKGAEMIFTNTNYADYINGGGAQPNAPQIVDKATSKLDYDLKGTNYTQYLDGLGNGLKITGTNTPVAFADASKTDQGVGSYSLALGNKLVDDAKDQTSKQIADKEPAEVYKSTNGVTFRMPKQTAVGTDSEYHATVTWTLAPGIK